MWRSRVRLRRRWPCLNVHADVGFGQILAVKSAAGHGVAHIRAELAVGSTGIHISAAGPVTERIDLGFRIGFA